MPRNAMALTAALSLTSVAHADTPPISTSVAHSALSSQGHFDSLFLRSVADLGDAAVSDVSGRLCGVCTLSNSDSISR